MIEYLANMIYHQDEPIADWVCIPLYFVSKLAHEAGMRVIQVGEGSDEQFCGYRGYMKYLSLFRYGWTPFRTLLPKAVQRLIAGAAKSISCGQPRLSLYSDIIDRAARDREHFWSAAMVFPDTIKERLVRRHGLGKHADYADVLDAGILADSYLAPDSFNVVSSFLGPFDRDHPGCDALTRMIYCEFRLRLPELLLMRVDKIGMSESLEARVPFLDHELVEFTMDIPQHWKIRGGEPKYLLKKAVEGLLPQDIIYREKMGFGAPMKDWLRTDFGSAVRFAIDSSGLMRRGLFDLDYIHKLFEWHQSGRENCSLHIWNLYNMTAWYDLWIDRKPVGAF
jgi:asparagine synthase (glutamine-hydrolysing)